MSRSNDGWKVVGGGKKKSEPAPPKHCVLIYEDSMGVLHTAVQRASDGRWWFGVYEGDERFVEMPHGRYYLSETHVNERGTVGKVGESGPAQRAADEFALLLAGVEPHGEWVNTEDPAKVNRQGILIIARGDDTGKFAFYDSNMGETGKAFKKAFKKSPNRKLTHDDVVGAPLSWEERMEIVGHPDEMPHEMKKTLNQWFKQEIEMAEKGEVLPEVTDAEPAIECDAR